MRILALTSLFPNQYLPHRAPFNRQQLCRLAESHDIHVIAPIPWTDELRARRMGKPPLSAGRRTRLDGVVVEHPRYYYPPKFGRRWYGWCFERSCARTFARAVEEFRPELVFAAWAYPDGWAAGRLARRHGLPVIVKCHGSDVLLLDKNLSRRRLTTDAVASADGVLAVSRHMETKLIEFGVSSERIRVIVNGIDKNRFHPGSSTAAKSRVGTSDGRRTLLFVGNLVHVKGLDVLLAASHLLLQAGFAHRLVVVGEGQLRADLERRAHSLGLQETVEFTGAINHAELPDWFRAADVVVLPSRSEGIPNVLLEASACGTPWVASRVGGIPEIADFGRSRLVTPGSPTELAQAIRESLALPPEEPTKHPRSNDETAAEMSNFFREVVESSQSSRRLAKTQIA